MKDKKTLSIGARCRVKDIEQLEGTVVSDTGIVVEESDAAVKVHHDHWPKDEWYLREQVRRLRPRPAKEERIEAATRAIADFEGWSSAPQREEAYKAGCRWGLRARDTDISALRHDLTRFKDICAGHEATLAALQKQNEGMREVLVDMASHADEGGCEGYFGTKAREALAAADESKGTNG